MGKTPRDIIFGPNRVNVSMDSNQAGATMASRYTVAKNAAIIGITAAPVGRMISAGGAVTGSRAYKFYGAIKRPILTLGVHKQIQGARTAMALSKTYGKMLLASSAFQLGRNLQLAMAKEYKRLGINVFGPPLSLFLYDNYMGRNKTSEDEIVSVAKEQSRRDGSLPSKSKTRGKNNSKLPRIISPTHSGGFGVGRTTCPPGYELRRMAGRSVCVLKE